MERELTVRQRRFASEIAAGRSRAQAYALAYPNQKMKKGTLEVEAKKTAKHPRVKAEIERMMLELLPPVQDMRAAYEHAFSTILKLTLESPDLRLRFDAARWLRAEYERRQQLSGDAGSESADRTLVVLRALYEQLETATDREEPLTLDVALEAGTSATDALSSITPSEAAGVGTVDELAEPACSCPGEEGYHHLVGSDPKFVLEPVPGSFPRRFRRIRVR